MHCGRPSEKALKAAEDAAEKADSATVMKQAKLASDQAKLRHAPNSAIPTLTVGHK